MVLCLYSCNRMHANILEVSLKEIMTKPITRYQLIMLIILIFSYPYSNSDSVDSPIINS